MPAASITAIWSSTSGVTEARRYGIAQQIGSFFSDAFLEESQFDTR